MSDLLHQDFDTVQSKQQPTPVTVASAATIAPTTRLTFVTGTVQVATITVPVTGYHELVFIFTDANPGALLTTGNIKTAYTPLQNKSFSLHYNPIDGKYWTEAVA
jgi:hypothetical protein